LDKNPEERFSAKKALAHPLFKLAKQDMKKMHNDTLRSNIQFDRKIRRKKMNVIKRGMLIFISTRLLPEQRYLELTQLFKLMDSESNGFLYKQ
jgi:hypothetical protein